MPISPNSVYDDLQKILLSKYTNIFDVFAALYPFCEEMYSDIHRIRSDIHKEKQIKQKALQIQKMLLPDPKQCKDPLDETKRNEILIELSDKTDYILKCFTFLYAIDRLYDNLYAGFALRSNVLKCNYSLNTDSNKGYVLIKLESPIMIAINKIVQEWEESTRKHYDTPRSGKSKGDFLRDYLENFVFIRPASGLEIDYKVLGSDVRNNFPPIKDCRITFVPLIKSVNQIIDIDDIIDSFNRRPFLLIGLTAEDKISELAIRILKKANDERSTVVVFPELSTSAEVRRKISFELSAGNLPNIKMVIAGSLHERISDKWYNTVYVFGPNGEELWQQNKFEPYTLKSYEAKHNPFLSKLYEHDSYENINTIPKILKIRDTPLGRMAILICSDFLLSESNYHKAVIDICVNFIVVPAMTANIEDQSFVKQAEDFSIYTQATTLISNSCATAQETENIGTPKYKETSLVYLPAYKPLIRGSCQDCGELCHGIECTKYSNFTLRDWTPSN